ncbi:hypothetical protein [Acidaminococcus massiliensis]|nr:hypothetical protein [Acidaminococcus massiliensis]
MEKIKNITPFPENKDNHIIDRNDQVAFFEQWYDELKEDQQNEKN